MNGLLMIFLKIQNQKLYQKKKRLELNVLNSLIEAINELNIEENDNHKDNVSKDLKDDIK